jgi:hypothetical protein
MKGCSTVQVSSTISHWESVKLQSPCILLILPCLQDIDGFWFSGIIDQARLRLARLPQTQARARASSGGDTSVRLGWRCIIFVILLNTIEIDRIRPFRAGARDAAKLIAAIVITFGCRWRCRCRRGRQHNVREDSKIIK